MWTNEDKWKLAALSLGGLTSAYIAAQYFNLCPSLAKPSPLSPDKGGSMLEYIKEHGVRQTQSQKDIISETKDRFPNDAKMLAGPDVAALLANLIRIGNCKRGIEVGVFTGYTTLTMATALPKSGGRIVALDVSEMFASVGKKYWKVNGVDEMIDLRIGPAVVSLDDMLMDANNLGSFDFAFIDADKVNYDAYYERVLKLLRKGGWIVFDNVFQGGYVNQTTVPEGRQKDVTAIRALNEKLKNDHRVSVSMLEMSDGITLVVKN